MQTATLPAAVPTLDETVPPIMIGGRPATKQEARAIAALSAVIDDQPPAKLKPFDSAFDWSEQEDGIGPEALQRKPVVRRPAVSEKIASKVAKAFKEVEPHLMPTTSVSENPPPAFITPGFERTLARAEMTETTTRDEMLAVAAEVAARSEYKEETKADALLEVADMPFGAATMRFFCY